MRLYKYLLPAGVLLSASAFTFMYGQYWTIDPHFSVRFAGSKASGGFKDLKGTIVFDPASPESAHFDVTVAVASINKGNGLKNHHAKSARWLDADTYPTIHFVSSGVVKTAEGYHMEGDLTMHGMTQKISFPFQFSPRADGGGLFIGGFEVDRTVYHIGSGDRPDSIKVTLSVPVNGKAVETHP